MHRSTGPARCPTLQIAPARGTASTEAEYRLINYFGLPSSLYSVSVTSHKASAGTGPRGIGRALIRLVGGWLESSSPYKALTPRPWLWLSFMLTTSPAGRRQPDPSIIFFLSLSLSHVQPTHSNQHIRLEFEKNNLITPINIKHWL